LDFAKAFDKVPHVRLCDKLSHYGINGTLLQWIKDFLSSRSQKVVLQGKYSESCAVLSVGFQGTVMAPLLFLLYINDIPNNIQCKLRLYTEDIIILYIYNKQMTVTVYSMMCPCGKWSSIQQNVNILLSLINNFLYSIAIKYVVILLKKSLVLNILIRT